MSPKARKEAKFKCQGGEGRPSKILGLHIAAKTGGKAFSQGLGEEPAVRRRSSVKQGSFGQPRVGES